MRIIIVLMFATFIFIKCYTPSYDEEIKNLDSLYLSLVSSEQILKKIDTNKIDKDFIILTNNFTRLDKKYGTRTHKPEAGIVEEYKLLNESFYPTYKIQLKQLWNELENNKKQIKELKHKLIGGYIPKSTFDSYLQIYKMKSLNMSRNISISSLNINENIAKSEKLNSKLLHKSIVIYK